MLTRPFVIQDYIVCGNVEGTVQDIGLVYTVLTTVDNRKVTIPNGTVANATVVNVTAQEKRQLDLEVQIDYSSDLKKAKEVLFSLLEENAQVIKEMEYRVFVDELADSAVILNMRCYFPQEVFWEEKWRMTENAKLALDEAGIEIAYPQLDVHMK